ncbi:MAG: hypothetical protein M0Z28_22735, partial [Rhodospirillales bacterium]|nr:hypothetical protein [Rhodospirillales bacterium]
MPVRLARAAGGPQAGGGRRRGAGSGTGGEGRGARRAVRRDGAAAATGRGGIRAGGGFTPSVRHSGRSRRPVRGLAASSAAIS